jgi:hypothetical protein
MTTPFDFSSKFFSELRPDTPGLVAPDIKTIKSAVRRQHRLHHPLSVPPEAITKLIIDPRAGGGPKPLRMF